MAPTCSNNVLKVTVASGFGALLKPTCESLIWTKLRADAVVRAAAGLTMSDKRGMPPLTVHNNPAPAHRPHSARDGGSVAQYFAPFWSSLLAVSEDEDRR
jgi:hypothetical protein